MNKKLILVAALFVVSTNVFAQQETQIEEVSIASKKSQEISKIGKNVKLLTQEDLQKFQGRSLNEVLDQVAGFQITGNFNNTMEPKGMQIRGGKSSNVLILLDGVPLKDVAGNDYNVTDLRWLALDNIESIEILNGASSVLYGSNATVSVVNITTIKKAKDNIEGLLSARGGSFSTFSQNGSVRGKLNDFNYQLNAFNEKSKGFSSAKGDDSFDDDGWEKQNISANVGYSKDRFNINVNGGWNHNLYQYDSGAFTDAKLRGEETQLYTGGRIDYDYTGGNLVLNTRYTNVQRAYQDFSGTSFEDQYLYKADDFFLEVYNAYQFNQFVGLTVGFQYEKQSMSYQERPWGENGLVDVLKFEDTNIATYDVFAKANFKYEGWNLDAGVRMNNHSKYKDNWVYSINPFYLGEEGNYFYKIGYSFSTAYIAPTLYQNFGSLPWILPNFDLKPETNQSHEIDLSFGTKDRKFVVNATTFQRQEKDGFAYSVVDLDTFAGQYINIDQNKIKGAEFGVDYRINDYIAVGGNFTYVEKDNSASMLRVPKQRVNSCLEINPFKTTRIYFTHQYVGKRADAYYDSASFSNNYVINDSFNVFNVNFNQKITNYFEVFTNIGNLFNTLYMDVAGFTTKPRNYTIGINYKF